MYVPGTILMWLAFFAGIASTITYWLSIKDPERWRSAARQSYVLMTVAIVAGSALLMYLLVTHDYRLHYVWAYSDNMLPLHYLISTFWGGQEGSFMLWIFWGVLLGLPLMRFARSYESRVMVIYNLTLLSLILLLVYVIPQFTPIFEELGGDLPLITKIWSSPSLASMNNSAMPS